MVSGLGGSAAVFGSGLAVLALALALVRRTELVLASTGEVIFLRMTLAGGAVALTAGLETAGLETAGLEAAGLEAAGFAFPEVLPLGSGLGGDFFAGSGFFGEAVGLDGLEGFPLLGIL